MSCAAFVVVHCALSEMPTWLNTKFVPCATCDATSMFVSVRPEAVPVGKPAESMF
jgi:hypothetical protein